MIHNKYWVHDDKIIFQPSFDNNKFKHLKIIKKYKCLIFSNYNDFNISLKTNNEYVFEYDKFYYRSCFNKKIYLPENLLLIYFGFYFNFPVILPSQLINLTF